MTPIQIARIVSVVCVTLAWLGQAARPQDRGPDYGLEANWICRPGDEGACAGGLDVLTLTAEGTKSVQKFVSAANPSIDCFYVYPTVSRETSRYSDMQLTSEVEDAARTQAGRLASVCRLFAPIYRQLTETGLYAVLAEHKTPDWRQPYADVLAAWRWYVTHENHGRGVVLVGHSQGSILLQKLIAEEVDGQRDQEFLVAAFLGGDLSFPVARGRDAGGVFHHVPLCMARAQTGCVYVWNSYLADDRTPKRIFGASPPTPLVAGCASPAAPGGGVGDLKAYLERPSGGLPSGPRYVAFPGILAGQCVADADGNVLRVSVRPGRFAGLATTALHAGVDGAPEGWGLHGLDMDLMQGNLLDRIADETVAWLRGRASSH